MKRVASITEIRSAVAEWRRAGQRVCFVPTMGYLHEGHLSLVEQARQHAERVVVSIFVNPTQFNNPQDFEKYPIDLPRDEQLLRQVGTDLLFVPDAHMIYGSHTKGTNESFQSWVNVETLTAPWEGVHRPGHFRGVTTVVSILFNIVQPDSAVFGEKDFQQLRVIEQMTQDLKFNIQIIRGALVREPDGLAMSSRNVRLTKPARDAARSLSRGLFKAEKAFRNGTNRADALIRLVREELLSSEQIVEEYVGCAAEHTLAPLKEINEPARLLLAAQVGGVRLIDNVALQP